MSVGSGSGSRLAQKLVRRRTTHLVITALAHVLIHRTKYQHLRNCVFRNPRAIRSTPQLATKAVEYIEQMTAERYGETEGIAAAKHEAAVFL
jgi:hypothetical protein